MIEFLRGQVRSFGLPAMVMVWGCLGCGTPQEKAKIVSPTSLVPSVPSTEVAAQGRLMPRDGILRIAATPGDRIEEIFVDVGQVVEEGALLVRLRSEQLRRAELEAAKTRLDEARRGADVKRAEGELAVATARNRVLQAEVLLKQAREQKELVEKQLNDEPGSQMSVLRRQLDRLVALHDAPVTRPMVGTMELESRRSELAKVESSLQSSLLMANQAVEAAEIGLKVAQDSLVAAEQSLTLVEDSLPLRSLEKQIEILSEQLELAQIKAPRGGRIINRLAEAGELTSGQPILELADSRQMVCVAEVHEADVGRLKTGDRAEMKSSALDRSLKGTIRRIDTVVGLPQMRSPNPMARTDFRAVPVIIDIDEEDRPSAASRLQLQVDVLIRVEVTTS